MKGSAVAIRYIIFHDSAFWRGVKNYIADGECVLLDGFSEVRRGRSESISGDCLPKTQLPANSQEDV